EARDLRRRADRPARLTEARQAGTRLPCGGDMAQDVIPGAGRLPPPTVQPTTIEAAPADQGRRSERARRSPYRARFARVYFALAVLAGSAIGAFIVLDTRPKAATPAAWSTWKPSGHSESARILQIVEHVPKSYRLAGGKPLVSASVSRPSFATTTSDGQPIEVPVSQITILPALDIVATSNALQVAFC